MTSDPKEPGMPFWATVVVVVVLVAYPLSVGPITGIAVRLPLPDSNDACSALSHTYLVPIEAVMSRAPRSVKQPYWKYVHFFQ